MLALLLTLACGVGHDPSLFDACMTKTEVLCACEYPWEGSENQTWCDIDAAKYCRESWEPMECLPYAAELLDLANCSNRAWASADCEIEGTPDECADEHDAYQQATSTAPPEADSCLEASEAE